MGTEQKAKGWQLGLYGLGIGLMVISVVMVLGLLNNIVRFPTGPVNRLFPVIITAIVVWITIVAITISTTKHRASACFQCFAYAGIGVIVCAAVFTTFDCYKVENGMVVSKLPIAERILPHRGDVLTQVGVCPRTTRTSVDWFMPDKDVRMRKIGQFQCKMVVSHLVPCTVGEFNKASELFRGNKEAFDQLDLIVKDCLAATTQTFGYISEPEPFGPLEPKDSEHGRMKIDSRSSWRGRSFPPDFRVHLTKLLADRGVKLEYLQVSD